jgi:hypothetical protein
MRDSSFCSRILINRSTVPDEIFSYGLRRLRSSSDSVVVEEVLMLYRILLCNIKCQGFIQSSFLLAVYFGKNTEGRSSKDSTLSLALEL